MGWESYEEAIANMEKHKPQKFIEDPILESPFEERSRVKIRAAGGWMVKLISPGTKGWPDNQVFWYYPGARRGFTKRVHLLEFKTTQPGSEISRSQAFVHEMLATFGHEVFIPINDAWIDDYIFRYRPVSDD